MIYKVINTLVILCALAGCSVVQQKVEMDASAAAMIAANSGDMAGAACFKALEPVVGTAPAGLLGKFEVARAGQVVIEDGPCAPLAAGLFLHLLNKIPGETALGQSGHACFFPAKTGRREIETPGRTRYAKASGPMAGCGGGAAPRCGG